MMKLEFESLLVLIWVCQSKNKSKKGNEKWNFINHEHAYWYKLQNIKRIRVNSRLCFVENRSSLLNAVGEPRNRNISPKYWNKYGKKN